MDVRASRLEVIMAQRIPSWAHGFDKISAIADLRFGLYKPPSRKQGEAMGTEHIGRPVLQISRASPESECAALGAGARRYQRRADSKGRA